MTGRTEHKPVIVPLAQQTGAIPPEREIFSRWGWVEPHVWTARMLATLEQGVEGGKWFRLFDKVFSERNLSAGLRQVAKNKGAPGVDHVTVTAFEQQYPEAIWELSDRLKTGTYRPQAIRRVHIPKPGTTETRPLAPVHCYGADGARSHCPGGGGERDRTDLRALPQR